MRYAILSDIHGNLNALEAVLQAAQNQAIDAYACLGDIVGYGPQPVECLQLIQRYGAIIIAGNHDLAACDKISYDTFNPIAREATVWTRNQLSPADVDFLANLPLAAHLDACDLAHGTLYCPELFDYVQTSYDAYLTMQVMKAQVCFVGHSHIPVNFVQREIICYSFERELRIPPAGKAIINVGSVGQPRDNDPRACYVVYDTGEQLARLHRVPYDIDAVSAKLQAAGLPQVLADRLRVGR